MPHMFPHTLESQQFPCAETSERTAPWLGILPERRPTATEVICCVCRPVTSLASLAERRSQKRSVPSKCPETAIVPSTVTRTAFTDEWQGSVLVQKPLPRSHTCAQVPSRSSTAYRRMLQWTDGAKEDP